MPGPTATPITLTAAERASLEAVVRARTSEQRAVERARIVLQAAAGASNTAIASAVGRCRRTVRTWRDRFAASGLDGLVDKPRSGRPPTYTAADQAVVKAIACELPHELGLPVTRLGSGEIHAVAVDELDPCPSRSTVSNWLRDDGLKPWTQTSWVSPRAPDFREKATPVLDLYEGLWDGEKLKEGDIVVCADEKTGVQALKREVDNRPAAAGRGGLVENTYSREGTVIYQAVLNVTEGGVIGHVVDRNTRANFETLVETVMTAEPYTSANRVFWIVDNGGTHHPNTFPEWLEQTYPNTVCVHLPVHASWLNQIELYFSVLGRKLLTGVDVPDTDVLTERLLAFEAWWSQDAEPFTWRFTADDLTELLERVPAMP